MTGAFLGVTGRIALLCFVGNRAQASLEAALWMQQVEEEETLHREHKTWFDFELSIN